MMNLPGGFRIFIRHAKGRLGAWARELLVYAQWFRHRQPGPRLLIFPSHDPSMGSSNLRAFALRRELLKRGWRVAICPKHLRAPQRRRVTGLVKPDVILLQKARHVLNRPRYFLEYPCVFDIDDADFHDEGSDGPVAECVRDSVSVIAGSTFIANWCGQINPNVTIIWTGTPCLALPVSPQSARPSIVAWASSAPVGQKKEADFLIEVIAEAVKRGADFKFRLYADNRSNAYKQLVERFQATGCLVETIPNLAYDEFLKSLDDVAIGLNPTIDLDGFTSGKSFGKALGYLERGVPSISHPNVDHPYFFNNENGILASGVKDWADHIVALLGAPERRQSIALAGRASLEQRLSIPVFADKAEKVLQGAIRS